MRAMRTRKALIRIFSMRVSDCMKQQMCLAEEFQYDNGRTPLACICSRDPAVDSMIIAESLLLPSLLRFESLVPCP